MGRVTIRGEQMFTTSGNILIAMSKPESVTKGGIIIPDTVKKETDFGGTIAVVSRHETELKVGMKVVVSKRSGLTIETDDISHDYKLYPASQIKYIYE
jgi:co-chaperonin GroES (HSP10)